MTNEICKEDNKGGFCGLRCRWTRVLILVLASLAVGGEYFAIRTSMLNRMEADRLKAANLLGRADTELCRVLGKPVAEITEEDYRRADALVCNAVDETSVCLHGINADSIFLIGCSGRISGSMHEFLGNFQRTLGSSIKLDSKLWSAYVKTLPDLQRVFASGCTPSRPVWRRRGEGLHFEFDSRTHPLNEALQKAALMELVVANPDGFFGAISKDGRISIFRLSAGRVEGHGETLTQEGTLLVTLSAGQMDELEKIASSLRNVPRQMVDDSAAQPDSGREKQERGRRSSGHRAM